MIKSIRFAILMDRARVSASRGDYHCALDILEQASRVFGTDGPSPRVPVTANLFYADICVRLSRFLDAFSACEIAIQQLLAQRGRRLRRFNGETIKYLLFHCKWILSLTTSFADSTAFNLAKKIDLTYDNIDVRRVSGTVRRTFPMSAQEARQLDRFFHDNALAP
ncbi:MAG TPA: hypothetical protein VGS12_09410 [Caulobacteraceae bacterium]|nr:hypothetical protein [Caulobacteraceae bacterium]